MRWKDFGDGAAAEEGAFTERLWYKEINYDYRGRGGAPADLKVSLPQTELCGFIR